MIQKDLYKIFAGYRPDPSYPTYPPYHTGDYLEDYFCNFYEDKSSERLLIPVSWTTCYIENKNIGLQSVIDGLDKNQKYFTVCQYDDGIKESLPPDTLQFNAGGNSGGVPLPLICSKMPNMHPGEKTVFCSFVGSKTHRVRQKMAEQPMPKDLDIQLWMKDWRPSIRPQEEEAFISLGRRSKFILCPRGYGLNSFRIYEALQMGAVPVIITDQLFLPWEDELEWSKFSVIIKEDMLPQMYKILQDIPKDYYQSMVKEGSIVYEDYFTLDGMCHQILKRVK